MAILNLASIGPVTSSTLRGLGLRVDIEARKYTIPGLIEAIVVHHEETAGSDNLIYGGIASSSSGGYLCRTSVLALLVPLFCFSLSPTRKTASSAFPPQEFLQQIRPEALRAHMEFLADDLLEGRGTGTRGFQLAANYVRAQFEEMGLKPAGDNGTYFQNIHFRKSELLPDQCSLTIRRDGSEQKLVIDKDFVMVGDPCVTDTNAEAPVVFVGLRSDRSEV